MLAGRLDRDRVGRVGIFCSRDIWGEPATRRFSVPCGVFPGPSPAVVAGRLAGKGQGRRTRHGAPRQPHPWRRNHEHHRQPADQRRRHADPVRDARRRPGAERDRQVPVPCEQHLGDAAPTAGRRTPASSAPARRCSTGTTTVVESDHPEVLVGTDQAPTPVEYLLHAIAACLTAGIANIAAARGVELHQGDLDGRGRHRPARHPRACPDDTVRNGYEEIRVSFEIEGDADDETLRGLVEQSRRRSAVYDALTNPTPVVIDVVTLTAATASRPAPCRSADRRNHDHHRHRRHRCRPRRPGREQVADRRPGASTWCSTGAGSASGGAASAGTRCAC